MRKNLSDLLFAEIKTINKTLRNRGVNAGTKPDWTLVPPSSMISYGIRYGNNERIKNVVGCIPEIQDELSRLRGKQTPIRVQEMPFALETHHPDPQTLHLRGRRNLLLPDSTALIGRSYTFKGGQDQLLDLDRNHHTLIAGMSGSGKTNVMMNILLTLAYNNRPEDLVIFGVDLKNSSMTTLRELPSVHIVAGLQDHACEVIRQVNAIKEKWIRTGERPYRLILAIDEMAELTKESLELVESIVSLGREIRINVIAATQHPLSSTVGGVAKASYGTRLVGRVTSKEAAKVAAGISGTGAESLPGGGAFVRVDEGGVTRFQSYYMADGGRKLLDSTMAKWEQYKVHDVEIHIGKTKELEFVTPEPAEDGVLEEEPAEDGVLEELAENFLQPDGTMKRGWKTAAVTALNGGKTPNGTTFQKLSPIVDKFTENASAQFMM